MSPHAGDLWSHGGAPLTDDRAGRGPGDPNLDDGYDWPAHLDRVEAAARTFR